MKNLLKIKHHGNSDGFGDGYGFGDAEGYGDGEGYGGGYGDGGDGRTHEKSISYQTSW